MQGFFKRQHTVKAKQWFKHGDHPVVRYDRSTNSHWIDTPKGRIYVTPGCYIVMDTCPYSKIDGIYYVCSESYFNEHFLKE